MTVVIGRSGWGALPPHWVVPTIDTVDAFVIHHAAGTQPTSFDESVALWQQYQRQHLNTWKCARNGHQFVDYNPQPACPVCGDTIVAYAYGDIAYNIGAGWNCCLVGRGVTVSDGATDADPTTATWSVCVLGDYTEDVVTPEIRAGIDMALRIGADLYGSHPIRPHRDYYATACPGDNLVALIPSLGDAAAMTPNEFFGYQLVLLEEPGPHPRQATVKDWFEWVHRELQVMRIAIEKLEAKL